MVSPGIGPAFVHGLVKRLTSRDWQQLEDRLSELIEANFRLGGPRHGFLYGGRFHSQAPLMTQVGLEKKLIHPELRAEAQAYLDEFEQMIRDETRLTNGLSTILKPCQNAQDVRDMLTDVVVSMIPDVKHLPRTRPSGWAFQGQSQKMHTFKEVTNLLEYYVSNQFL